MGTTVDAERKIITELTQLLRNNADKLLSGETKLCLTTSSLGTISANFRRISDLSEEDERRELEGGRSLITRSVNGQIRKKVEEVKRWRDNIRTLQDFVVKTRALKIIHGTYTIKAPVQIARFHSLQVLEVKKVPIHMVEGLSKLRCQLREIIITRSLQKLQDIFEICGGDRSSGLTWHNLKTAYLGFNGLEKLDTSLKFVPFLEVFDLSHNNLKDTEDWLQSLTYLLRINFGFNQLTKVPQFSNSIKGILKTLVLRNNNLDTLEGIEELTALEELDIAHNMLVDHQCLLPLLKFRKLMILCLVGNPLSYKWNHRMKTLEYLSPTVGFGHFLLDGQRLSAQETSVLKESHYKKNSFGKGSYSSTIIIEQSSSHTNSIEDENDVTDSMDGSLLSVKSVGSKKKGHRRMASKERKAIIADITEDTDQELIPEEISPTGSLVEDPKELERIDSEKRKYEIMREHYKDDWLKALLADQGRLTENKTEDQSIAEDQSIEPEIVTATVKAEEAVNVEPKAEGEIAVQDAVIEKELAPQSSASPTKEVKAEVKAEPSTPSTPLITINPMTDIYSLRQAGQSAFKSRAQGSAVRSPEPVVQPQGIEWGRTDSQQEEYYGEESAPFIVMLPDQDMKQLFITVNERYITEKDMFGEKCAMLDLKCLQRMSRSDEILHGKDIIGGLLVPFLTLEFDYVRKDMRRRVYAMEDDAFAKEFEALVDKHIRMKEMRSQMKELVECLKCQHQFYKPQKSTASSIQCPKCKSTMVIELNIRQFDHESTRESQGKSTPGKDKGEEKKRKESQPSPRIQRKKAVKKLEESTAELSRSNPVPEPPRTFSLPDVTVPQMRERTSERLAERHRSFRNIQVYEEYDSFQESSTSVTSTGNQSQIKHINSWSDIKSTGTHSAHSLPRGSTSSVESDIAILATNSSKVSISAVSEISVKEITNKDSFSDKDSVSEPVSCHVTDEKRSVWITDGQEQVTPVGSPLTNSVCNSMVSSVYENTLPGAAENNLDANTQSIDNKMAASDLKLSSKGSYGFAIDQINEKSETTSYQTAENQNRYISNSLDTNVKVLVTSEESTSVYTTPDSSVYDQNNFTTGDDLQPIEKSSESISTPSIYDTVSSQSEPKTSSPDNSYITGEVIRRNSWSRRSVKKRSGYYGAENFESSSELNDSSSTSNKDQPSVHSSSDFPNDISPIKRTSKNRQSNQAHRSAVIIDTMENLTVEDDSVSLDVSKSPTSGSEADVSSSDQVNISHSTPAGLLPWETEDSTDGASKNESFSHEEFVNVDHRLQLYLELKVFTSTETCQCVLHCNIVQYMKTEAIKSLLVISTARILLYQVIGDLNSDSASDWLKCYEDQPITELQFVDAGLGYQSLRLEFGTDCSSYTLLIMDEGRCKRFLTLLTDIVQTVSMNEHSKLEGISKSNPTTQTNIETQLLNTSEEEPQGLVKYLLIQLIDNDDPEKREIMGLAVTPNDLILIEVNHQWPLPRLQAPLSPDVKGQQFTVIRKEPINNIETFEFNEFNPKELRLSFFDEGSDEKVVWVIAMETTQGVKSLVDAIREPWENEFGVSFDITPVSFSEGEQT